MVNELILLNYFRIYAIIFHPTPSMPHPLCACTQLIYHPPWDILHNVFLQPPHIPPLSSKSLSPPVPHPPRPTTIHRYLPSALSSLQYILQSCDVIPTNHHHCVRHQPAFTPIQKHHLKYNFIHHQPGLDTSPSPPILPITFATITGRIEYRGWYIR